MTAGDRRQLVDIELLGVPVALYRQAAEHFDELRREFIFISRDTADRTGVPHRLTELINDLDMRFATLGDQLERDLAAAVEQGQTLVDLHHQIPAGAGTAIDALVAMLDEADDYCRRGSHLLTLATPPRPLAFRRWFFGQFRDQIDGADPTPWKQWEATQPDPFDRRTMGRSNP